MIESHKLTIAQLKQLRESEDHVEFKEGKTGFPYGGGNKALPKERRRCVLGYAVALANERGGRLVLGMSDKHPHAVVGTSFYSSNLGKLEAEIFNDLRLRVRAYELIDEATGKRVVVIEVPGRPRGVALKFEEVPLMRVGEELHPMSDDRLRAIWSETESDFSEQICPNLSIEDLDPQALAVMRTKYVAKTGNTHFLTLSPEQCLRDLRLITNEGVTNAALILLGRQEILAQRLPQAQVRVEYRNSQSSIPFDQRVDFQQPFFLGIDQIWTQIQARNGNYPVQRGPYIFDIPYFNEEVVREALHNAIAHRDYASQGEIVVRQYPMELHIQSPGGLPYGVTLDNLLTVQSTPRNRLLADVLTKTGIVERSGQGIDKIYRITLSEAKPKPDYHHTTRYSVELRLSGTVQDKAFALFIRDYQEGLADGDKLTVQEVIALDKIRQGIAKSEIPKDIAQGLEKRALVERIGKTSGQKYCLSRLYYAHIDERGEYSRLQELTLEQLYFVVEAHLKRFGSAKMGDFEALLQGLLTRAQIKTRIAAMVNEGWLTVTGVRRGSVYRLSGLSPHILLYSATS